MSDSRKFPLDAALLLLLL